MGGTVTDIQDAELPARAMGAIYTVSKITLGQELITSLLPAALVDLPLELSLNLIVQVQVGVGIASWKTEVEFDKDCGMQIAGLPQVATSPDGARLGPMTCA